MKNFIEVPFEIENLDRWYIRQSILKSLTNNLFHLEGRLLDIGCGQMPYKDYILKYSKVKEYVGVDIESALIYNPVIKPDVIWDGKQLPLDSETFNCSIGTEVLEHCAEPEVLMREVYRVLKPGGVFFFTVPFLWNLHEVPNDEYRYTPFSLKRHLNNSGFQDVEMEATGGWHASMAQMMGLWVRRSYIPANKRKILSTLVKPVIKYLVNLDKLENVKFENGQMITGIAGIAKKAI